MAVVRSDLLRGGGDPADPAPGTPVADPFRALEDSESPTTRRWLAARAEELAAAREGWPAREALAAEIRRLAEHEDYSAPQCRGGALFAAHRPPGAEHPRLLRLAGPEERTDDHTVVFDPACLDPSGATTLDAWEVSPDGRHAAVQTSRDGTERGTLRVLAVDDGRCVDTVPGVRYSHVAWLPRLRPGEAPGFYYVRREDGGAGARRGVWLRRPGTPAPDALVHGCTAAGTVPGARIEAGRWLLLSEGWGTGHREDLWIADVSEAPACRPRPVPVHVGVEGESEARVGPDGMLYLRTSVGGEHRRVCRADPHRPGRWKTVVPGDDGAVDAFGVVGTARQCELLVSRTTLGISELSAHDPADGRLLRRVPLPGQGMVTRIDTDVAPDGSAVAYVSYADVARAHRVLYYRAGTTGLAGDDAVWPPGTAPAREAPPVRRRVLHARSADGTEVPVSVFSLGATAAPGPTILHAYGAYGRSRQFGYSATVLAWLRAGGTYAVAHVRGGGEFGKSWHRAGARRNKPAGVEDLLAAAEELPKAGVCAPGELCLSGGSAGGLLVLAAAVRRPAACRAVIALAPLADMARFESMGLGAMWTEEFGTMADGEDAEVLLSYSPYQRVLAGGEGREYPAVLLNGFHGDTRTGAAHPRKMCAALRCAAADPRSILLRYEYGVGHGPRAVSRAVALAADAHAFAAHWTGLSRPGTPRALHRQEAR